MSLQELRERMNATGTLLGSVRVDGVDFAYIQVPDERGKHSHWFMGADRNGLRAAGGWKRGPLTTAGANPTPDNISARLAKALTESTDDHHLSIATVHLLRQGMTIQKLTTALAVDPDDAWRIEAQLNFLLRDALEPLKTALGKTRMRIARCLDGDGSPSKGLLLTKEEVESAQRFERERPWAAPLVLATGGVDYLRDDDGILRHALDIKKLHPAIARRLGPATGRFDLDCARMARVVPVDWLPGPDDAREWAGFRIVAEILGAVPGALATRYESLLAPVKGRWAEYVLKLAGDRDLDGEDMLDRVPQAEEGDRLSPLRDYATDTIDMMLTLDFWAGNLPNQANWDENGESRDENLPAMLLAGDRGLGSFLEISRAWHADPAFHEHGKGSNSRWEPILPDRVDEATGIRIEVLKGSVELEEEGARGFDRAGLKGLWHCVGGDTYVEACASDRVRIVSMRKDIDRLSTAEIQLGELFSVRQHRGWKNGPPSLDADAALARYIAHPEVRSAAERARPQPRRQVFSGRGPIDMEATFERWRPYLAGEFRRMNLDELVEAISQPPAPSP